MQWIHLLILTGKHISLFRHRRTQLFPRDIFASGSASQMVVAAEAYNFLPDKRPSSLTSSKYTPLGLVDLGQNERKIIVLA